MIEIERTARVLLLLKASSYRAAAFLDAAAQLGIEIIRVVDAPHTWAPTGPGWLAVDFKEMAAATATIVAFAAEHPVDAVLAVDDSGALLAAEASKALGLPHNGPEAAEAARDKYRMRSLMAAAGVPVPWFRRFHSEDDVAQIAAAVPFPCVVKPLRLSGSQGVIRADNAAELAVAIDRLTRLLARQAPGSAPYPFLVEEYIPGVEVALEGMLHEGRLHVLALFDKPDPLEGPFFEETIYVTPSRLPAAAQEALAGAAAQAAASLGLRRGPVHAELRLNAAGPWLLEVAGRSIGGLCSQTLRFGVNVSLEALILRQAVGLPLGTMAPHAGARGVMMIPIPAEGLLRAYTGDEAARAVPHITGVEITTPLNHHLKPLPEGDAYLGFIFAEAATPQAVEAALRAAHEKLQFEIEEVIPLSVGNVAG